MPGFFVALIFFIIITNIISAIAKSSKKKNPSAKRKIQVDKYPKTLISSIEKTKEELIKYGYEHVKDEIIVDEEEGMFFEDETILDKGENVYAEHLTDAGEGEMLESVYDEDEYEDLEGVYSKRKIKKIRRKPKKTFQGFMMNMNPIIQGIIWKEILERKGKLPQK